VALEVTDEVSHARLMLRELPKRKLVLVLLIVGVNLGYVTWRRGCDIEVDRISIIHGGRSDPGCCTPQQHAECERRARALLRAERRVFIPPWQWSRDEWVKTVWPWK
jgi:hypothetical protein